MLRSSQPVYLKQDLHLSASDINAYRNKQQLSLLSQCRRSLAISVGRGMLTIGSLTAKLADTLIIPPLPLSGRVQPGGTLIHLDAGAAPPELTLWPEFHNAVAAGLRLMHPEHTNKQGKDSMDHTITRSWISFMTNSISAPAMGPNTSGDKNNAVAGVLYALGLQGKLGCLSMHDIVEYLSMVSMLL